MSLVGNYGSDEESSGDEGPQPAPAPAVVKHLPERSVLPTAAAKKSFFDALSDDDNDTAPKQKPSGSLSFLLGALPAPKVAGPKRDMPMTEKQKALLEKRRKLFSVPALDDVGVFESALTCAGL